MLRLNLTFDITFWALLLSNLSSCVLISPLPLLPSLQLSPLPSFSTSLVLSPPLSLSSLWCQPPGLLDQRAFLWDHLERPVEVEEEREREGTRNRERGGRRKKWEPIVESLGGGSVRGKEVFLSRSTAAQSHIQYFPLCETHLHILTCTYNHACTTPLRREPLHLIVGF